MRGIHISITVTTISIILAATLLALSIAAFNMPAAQAATTGTLIINSTTVLTEDHDGNIIIAADNITLDGNGHTVTGNGTGDGVFLNHRTGVTVKNLKIKNFATGISVAGQSSNNSITGNTISNNGWDGIGIQPYSSNNSITGNTISNNQNDGIYLHINSGNTVAGNNILNNGWDGIFLDTACVNSTITGNIISNNEGRGIGITISSGNTVTGNTISNNTDGITLRSMSRNNTVTGNTVSKNKNLGIAIYDSYDNKISRNNFIDNPTQAYGGAYGGRYNLFNLPAPIGGNYWSNYDTPADGCVDTSPADGFCDNPYVFTRGNDSLPWTRMNGWLKPIIILTFQGYDYDNKGEVSILVNNQPVTVLPTRYSPENNNLFTTYSLDISTYVMEGINSLTFQQNLYSSGVRNVAIKSSSTTIYSNSTYYSIWVGGSRESVTYIFGTSPVVLTFQGYDYNNRGEVSILVNDQVAYTLPTSYSPQNAKTYASFTLDISKYVHAGSSNTVTFRQNTYSSAVKEVQVTQLGSTIYSNSTRYSIWIGGRESVTYTFNVP